jgi:NAD(P)-dependent dehydrogenase (short-subunit alcohol dehydrogenase family)
MDILKNKIALITGGTSGIGLATAMRFQKEGATVIATGSSEESAEAARKELPGVEVLVSDAGDPSAAKALVDQVHKKHGRIDVLFVNAGIARVAPIGAVDEALFDKVLNVNLKGPYFLIKHAIPVLKDGAVIILTSSVGAHKGMPGLSVYSATKAALHSLGLTLAVELAPRWIRVNIITAGHIDTPISGKMGLGAEQLAGLKKMAEKVPLKRPGQPEEIAAAALYFASSESGFTTGSEMRVDGAMSLV